MIEIYTVIFIGCSLGLAWSSYKIGRREGAEACLDILCAKKIICYDATGEIQPNPFYLPDED